MPQNNLKSFKTSLFQTVYQNVTQGTANIHEQRTYNQEKPGQSIYNHLQEKKEIEDTGDHYDHAHRVPFELTATEKDYETLKLPPQANNYTEVIADETEHSRYRSGEENDHYFVLDDKRSQCIKYGQVALTYQRYEINFKSLFFKNNHDANILSTTVNIPLTA